MKNFIDLDASENYEIKKPKIKSTPVAIEEVGIKIPKVVLSEKLDKEEYCVIEKDASDFYGEREIDGCFKRENLFSELANEFERAQARQNLGIADTQTMNWGFIKGNIENQKDLKDFVFNSPDFHGTPQAPTPDLSDASRAIATTEWVVNYIIQNGGVGGGQVNPTGLKSFTINPSSALYGDQPVVVTAKWEYNEEVSEQKVNGEVLDLSIRSKQFTFSSPANVKLEYTVDKKSYSKLLSFSLKYPYYFGTSSDYTKLGKTTSKSFNFNIGENEYAYLILPIENATLAVNGFVGGFNLINEQDLHGQKYYTYKSANHSLGKLIVNLLT